jgi:hypothetical protein
LAASAPQPNGKQNRQQKQQCFQRLRSKMTSKRKREPA